MSWLYKCVHHFLYRNVYRKKINNVQNTGKYWSKWVDKVWEENCTHIVHLNSVMELTDTNQNNFIVKDGNNNTYTWKVYYVLNKYLDR